MRTLHRSEPRAPVQVQATARYAKDPRHRRARPEVDVHQLVMPLLEVLDGELCVLPDLQLAAETGCAVSRHIPLIIRPDVNDPLAEHVGYSATCTCGWRGPERDREREARDDHHQHLQEQH